MLVEVGGSRSTWREPTQAQGQHANDAQTEPKSGDSTTAKLPVMIAGSIQLAVLSQLRLCEMPAGPPMWLTLLEDEEDEEQEEFGRPPKLILMLGRSALRPSCHSFTFKPSIEPLFSAGGEEHNTSVRGLDHTLVVS